MKSYLSNDVAKLSTRGFSLVEVLVAFGLLSILIMGIVTLMSNSQKDVKRLEQKLESLDLKNMIIGTVAGVPEVCGCQFGPAHTFDSTVTNGSQVLNFTSLVNFCPGGSNLITTNQQLPSGLTIDQIRLTNLMPTAAANVWTGDWTISFQNVALRPITVNQKILIDNTNPSVASVVACHSTGRRYFSISGCNVSCPLGWTETYSVGIWVSGCNNSAAERAILCEQ